MNKRRLLKLADLLEADAKNRKGIKFDLCYVGAPSAGGTYAEKVAPLDCGTTACAMGLAAISGAFRRAGLSYRIKPGDAEIRTTINGRSVGFIQAAKRTFGITEKAAWWLFMPGAYPYGLTTGAAGERYVAKRIRDFVAGKVAP